MNNSTYHLFFTNLANPLKVQIITSLRKKEKNVGQLSTELKVEQSKVSHALKNLKNCKIVDAKQKGKERIYSLNKKTIIPMLNLIDKHAKNFCKCECCANKKCGRRKNETNIF
jgi:DNA-binding transcriptional ArsR family regulator